MRIASAFMFLVSGVAGWLAFGLYRHLHTPPGAVAPVEMTEHLVMIGGHAFSPVQVLGTLIAVAVLAGLGGIGALVAGHDNCAK